MCSASKMKKANCITTIPCMFRRPRSQESISRFRLEDFQLPTLDHSWGSLKAHRGLSTWKFIFWHCNRKKNWKPTYIWKLHHPGRREPLVVVTFDQKVAKSLRDAPQQLGSHAGHCWCMSSEDSLRVVPSVWVDDPPKCQAQCFAAGTTTSWLLVTNSGIRRLCTRSSKSPSSNRNLFENSTAQVCYIKQSMTRTTPEEQFFSCATHLIFLIIVQ